MHDIRVSITPAVDTFEQNNSADTLVQVLGPQRVLIAGGSPGEGTNVAAALHAAGIQATVVEPASVPNTPTGVGAYQAVALVNVSAQQLDAQQMEALRDAARDGTSCRQAGAQPPAEAARGGGASAGIG
jgi:2-polyprenyl-6-methoxyphenol hydroxylase-like FAD-dependent oxidoreductase